MSWEHRKNLPSWNKGMKMSEEHKEKLRQAHLGKKLSEEHRLNISRGSYNHAHKDELSSSWKGDQVSKRGLHRWVDRKLGKPKQCENCDTKDAKWYDWANISGQYLRDLSDWARLCRQCHNLFDNNAHTAWQTKRANGTTAPWNKGKTLERTST